MKGAAWRKHPATPRGRPSSTGPSRACMLRVRPLADALFGQGPCGTAHVGTLMRAIASWAHRRCVATLQHQTPRMKSACMGNRPGISSINRQIV